MNEPPTLETTHDPTDPVASFPADEELAADAALTLGLELGLAEDEYERIVETLGRTPTKSELGMYSVMWSEHCSYKSSKVHLRNLPTEGPQVLVGPGENAGVVDVGDGLAVSFKIESHNHPSYVEPYQGAATGVGGILRDIFTMGARPIAIMDPLRFGRPDDPFQRHLVDGVVRGVGGYGNCVGVPNIGGETVFDDVYAGNPLVNVFAIGVLPKDRLQLAVAERPGDIAVLLGSSTGRDGIGGASVLASAEFDASSEDKRPNVQVGDPFAEKLLIECCLELYDRDLLSGIQDMGAAGIACSTAEMASKAKMGMNVDLDAVHLREPSMESWEILCSESQERMLALVQPDQLDEVLAVADKWGVPASVVGEVVEGDDLVLSRNGEVVAALPARSLADEGPTYERPMQRPAWMDDYAAADAEALTLPDDPLEVEELVLEFLADPNIGSKRWVWEQYDSIVLSGTVLGPGEADAGVVRLPDSDRAVAASTDGNGRWCQLDPREGTRRVVAEAFRNVACVGARPLATTNCLNFGNPERPEIMWQFAEAVAGLGEAAEALGIPVTGGNVSFYNETRDDEGELTAIHPTPVVGVLGVLDRAEDAVPLAFQRQGDVIFVLGEPVRSGLAGSELQRFLGEPLGGTLAPVDLEAEAALGTVLAEAARAGLLRSAHDVSGGGLLTALVESAVAGDVGIDVHLDDEVPLVQSLFSESPGRVIVSATAANIPRLAELCQDAAVPITDIGTVGGQGIVIGDLALGLSEVVEAYENAVPAAVDPTAVSR